MALTVEAVTVDCADPARLAAFWGELLGYEETGRELGSDEDWVEIAPVRGGATPLLFLQVPDRKTVKNRLHLDLRPADQAAEVQRALALGAVRVDIGQGTDVTWVVLADPEGNEFCILRPPAPGDKVT